MAFDFFGLMLHTNGPYVGMLCFGTFVFGMKSNGLVPVGILVPTPLANRPSLLANNVAQVSLVAPFMRCCYLIDDPVSGSMTALILCVVCEVI